ncbi:MAG: light-harvesting protein [Sphingomonas sp. 28-62-20]|uniref:light-harvesting protein n=1 Tax=Sphingomonas sp. 28-62-20 TaxID=1970433 RepID=UPI000A0BD372|nr:light-harvesting protein [Sphingomonas sp.]OQW72795.1 MAG: light-harvesting protein [Proteobacteria bacterium ST_bin13]OYY78584.1 MAG: light-harvesting protein [Sphingomonas sp. 28-62-20]
MKEGRIWLYVSPNVGLPLFFIAFVTASLLVHASIMTHTTWVDTFWQGASKVEAPAAAAPAAAEPAAEMAPAADAMATNEAAK